MFNLRIAVFSGCIVSLMSLSAAAVAEPAAPARTSEISAILDQQKPDPSRLERNRAAADVQPPAGGNLGQFYYRRAQARAALARNEEAIADLQQAMSQGGDLATEIARYSQLLAQQYRVVGKIKAAIDTELALAKKVEAAPRGKGLLFGIYLRTLIGYLSLGDMQQAEVYLNKNLALLAESRKWPNVDAFRSSWEANVENGRARFLMRRGKYSEAEAAFRKSQGLLRDALAKSVNWPNKPASDLMEASIDFAIMQEGEAKSKQGRQREAEADVRRALLSRLKTVGKYHPDTAQVTLSLSQLMTEQSSFGEAEQLARTSVEIYRAIGYPESADGPCVCAQSARVDAVFPAQMGGGGADLRPDRRCHRGLGAVARGTAAARLLAHLHQLCDQADRPRYRGGEATHRPGNQARRREAFR